MSALPVPRQEAFAFALATGLSQSEASAKAGYANSWKHTRQRAKRPEIVARVTALRDAPAPAARTAARGLPAGAAKLKGRPEDSRMEDWVETPESRARFLPLSHEDWMAEYGHLG